MNKLRKVYSILAVLFLYSAFVFAQQTETGMAKFYSDGLQGHPTAYGEFYDRAQFTASHRTYPKGTLLKVTRLDNSKSVIVRVNDRGPFRSDGSILDLSMAAASLIDLTLSGNANVKVEYFGFAENNATAANYNAANGQSSNAFAFDRIYNGAPQNPPQDTPQEYFTPRGSNGYPSNNNFQQPGSQNTSAVPQYGPVPPSYDRRFQSRGVPSNYNTSNEIASQTPSEYNNYSGNNRYVSSNPATNSNATLNGSGSIGNFPSLAPGSGYSVQVGSYANMDNALRQAQSLVQLGLREVYLSSASTANGINSYKIFAGRFDNRETASVYANQIKRQFLVTGFVLRL
jgi:rare lipoprotein A